jgi:hypothetical protein
VTLPKVRPEQPRPFIAGESVLVVGLLARRRARFLRYHDRELTIASVQIDFSMTTLMLPATSLERRTDP